VFLGGIQLISIGIIGEYISRINKNTINRPLYIIAEQNIVAGKEKII
jgi:dolichol-phosphate mannosyltransferase